MKLLKAEISNYKSLRNVEIEFGDLSILIGQNSSGKSNFIEALYLFFNEFDANPQRIIIYKEPTKVLWTGKNVDSPIRFVLTFQLTKKEYNKLFNKSTREFINAQENKLVDIKVFRELHFKAPKTIIWMTPEVVVDNLSIEINSSISVDDKKEEIKENKPPEKIIANIVRDRLVDHILQKLSDMFKESFQLVPSARNAFGGLPHLGERNPNMPPEIEKKMVATCDSEDPLDTKTWYMIEEDIQDISSLTRITTRNNSFRCREGFTRFPLSQTGGGDQEFFMISYFLREGNFKIIAIEEPETHLHPHLSRKLFEIFEEVSTEKQIIITTHSSIFVDLSNLNSSWVFRNEKRETTVQRIENTNDLRDISNELGIRPSDIFFADKILFVEGRIDKIVYCIWAKKLGIDLLSPLISVIPLGGKTEGKRHLKAWMQVTKNVPVSVSMILDNDAKEEAEKLIMDNYLARKQISVLKEGAIEDYYNEVVLIDVMNQRYKNQFTADDLKPKPSVGLKKFFEKHYTKKRDRSAAKKQIGKEVAKRMTAEQIPNEIREALKSTERYLELPKS